MKPDILIVGAGPTGLALALQAAVHGANVRVVERRPGAFRPSRALMMHIRTLEVLRPLGVVEQLLARADTRPQISLHVGRRMFPVRLSEFALPDTAYPHLTLLRQMDVESVLGAALADQGVTVERGTELVDLANTSSPRARLRGPAGEETVDCGFLVGCDGVESIVRGRAGIGWRGGDYRQEVVLADVDLAGLSNDEAHVAVGRHGLLFTFPLGEGAQWRLLATRLRECSPRRAGETGFAVPARQLTELVNAAHLPARITSVGWSSRVRLRYGLADAYRNERVFLAGDAAHVNSPAGGQGLNTGVQDAMNLGWKLAYAPQSCQPQELLDSYQQERRPVARSVRALTDLLFWAESGSDPFASLARSVAAPLAAPLLMAMLGRHQLVAQGIRVISQLRVSYRDSPLSIQTIKRPPGHLHAGERAPDETVVTEQGPVRLHELLARPGIGVLLQCDASPSLELGDDHVHVHRLNSWPGTGVVTIRPDGYVGLTAGNADVPELESWLTLVGA